jgi:hypothetical protein
MQLKTAKKDGAYFPAQEGGFHFIRRRTRAAKSVPITTNRISGSIATAEKEG